MIKIAHRGFSYKYGDNNIVSFKKAIKNKFDIIEMDIQLNKDNQIIIYHDLYFKNELIRNLSYNKIKKFKILTLKNFFKNINYKNIKIIMDMKGDSLLSYYLIKFIKKYDIDTTNIIFASFNEEHLIQLKKYNFNLGFITSNNFYSNNFFNTIKNYKYILVDINTINKNFIDKCKSKNKIIYCFTCHNKFEKKLFYNFNIDGIISNIL